MYDINTLEEEWRRYKRKQMRPWIVLLFVVILAIVTVLFTDKTTFEKIVPSVPEEKAEVKPVSTVYIDGPILKPEEKRASHYPENPLPVEAVSAVSEGGSYSKQTVGSKSKLHIEVVEAGHSSNNAYKEVAKRFRMGHDPDDSLFLAKAYYLKGMYKKAEYWALQTNKVNENIEESWLVFAKAKVKQGHRNEAIRVLNEYIKRTNSAEAKIVLNKIKKGVL